MSGLSGLCLVCLLSKPSVLDCHLICRDCLMHYEGTCPLEQKRRVNPTRNGTPFNVQAFQAFQAFKCYQYLAEWGTEWKLSLETTKCPGCQYRVVKSNGCQHMH